jgi:hypothetical protein
MGHFVAHEHSGRRLLRRRQSLEAGFRARFSDRIKVYRNSCREKILTVMNPCNCWSEGWSSA